MSREKAFVCNLTLLQTNDYVERCPLLSLWGARGRGMGVCRDLSKFTTPNFSMVDGIGPKLPPLTGWLVMLGGLSLAGVPPMNGFISKLTLIQGGVDRQDWISVILMVGFGILTLMYMIRAWQTIFQQKPSSGTAETKAEGDSLLAPFLLICACLLLGIVFAEPLIQLVSETVRQFEDPNIYNSAVRLVTKGS